MDHHHESSSNNYSNQQQQQPQQHLLSIIPNVDAREDSTAAAAAALQAEELVNSLLMHGAFGTPTRPRTVPVLSTTASSIPPTAAAATTTTTSAETTSFPSVSSHTMIPPSHSTTATPHETGYGRDDAMVVPVVVPPVYFNHGLALWETNRRVWLKRNHHHAESVEQQRQQQEQRHALELNVDEIIDTLFASSRQQSSDDITTTSQQQQQQYPPYFSMSIPLPQMIDILQDLWEAEGLET
jgi:hypothetical protein